ncbi:MAG: phosphoenolpyruvate--protein phosphotransferase [Acidobacteriota bacterium]
MIQLIGIPVSPGVASGPAVVLLQNPFAIRYTVAQGHVAREAARLDEAARLARRQLEQVRERVTRSSGPELASLFDAQLLMLDDQPLVPRAKAIVETDCLNAEWALQRAFDEVSTVFDQADDAYLRERRGDVADVVGRLARALRPTTTSPWSVLAGIEVPSILVVDELAPSVAGQLEPARILGVAIDGGSRTHHASIIVRSRRVPAVAGLRRATALIRPGAMAVLDGDAGEFVLDPTPDAHERVLARHRGRVALPVRASDVGPVTTADNQVIRFEANVETPAEVPGARAAGAEGIGLFRSEFAIGLESLGSFDEDRQYRVYRALVEGMAPLPVTVRTFDVDEFQVSGNRHPVGGTSRGPLGLRAIRLSLDRRDVFDTQLRALVRASRHGPIRILFPLISSVEELRAARSALRGVQSEISEGEGRVPDIPVGVMIEVPSAALTADLLARDADFFSIGTNDLVQYCLAVDRSDGRVADLYDPLHPAILRVIRQVIRAAARHRKPLSVCGEMAGDPASLAILMGLGVTTFSMAPSSIAPARAIVAGLSLAEMRRVAARAMRLGTGREIRSLVVKSVAALRPPGAGRREEGAGGRAHGES